MKQRFSFWLAILLLFSLAAPPASAGTVQPLQAAPAGRHPSLQNVLCLQNGEGTTPLESAEQEEARIEALSRSDVAKPGIHVNPRWNYVMGQTVPNASVTITLRSSTGAFKEQVTVRSSSTGSFFGFFSSCNPVTSGDTVRVQPEGGPSMSTTVVPLSGWINPNNETVSGMTAADRNVEMMLYQAEGTCTLESSNKRVTSSGAGAYFASYAGSRDIKRYGTAEVWVYDANGHSTFVDIAAPHIELTQSNDLSVTLAPDRGITATVSAGGAVHSMAMEETVTGETDAWGDAYLFLTQVPLAGDQIEVTDGTTVLTYDVVPFALTNVDPAANRVEGTTAANRRIEAGFISERRPTCEAEYLCRILGSDASGNFTIVTDSGPFNLSPGDEMDFSIFDAEGNWQRVERHPRQIQVNLDDGSMSGFWDRPGAPLNALLRAPGGAVKESWATVSGVEMGNLFVPFQQQLMPGDRVEIGDGAVVTDTVEVKSLTAFANGQTDRITGQAPASHPLLLAGSKGCTVVNVPPAGAYDSDLGGANLQAGDQVTAYHFDGNGNSNTTRTHVPQINPTIGNSVLQGYVERANVPVAVTVRSQGNTILATGTYTATNAGRYVVPLANGGPLYVAEGYQITVQGEGGVPTSLTVPPLAIQIDPQGNRITGQTLPNRPVEVTAFRGFTYLGWVSTTSDGNGDYVASFDGKKTLACDPSQIDPCTKATVMVTMSEGHRVSRATPDPANVTADAYEGDNTAATAKSYTSPQSHTFHQILDVDWVKFSVSGDDVGKGYTLATANPGTNADTILLLYDTDGTTLLAQAGAFGGARTAVIHHRFAGMGTYYVKVEPASLSNTTLCGSTYLLVIGNRSIYLPLQFRRG